MCQYIFPETAKLNKCGYIEKLNSFYILKWKLSIYCFPRCLPVVELRLVLVTPDLVLARLATPGDTPDQGPDRPRPDPVPTVAEVIGSLNLLCPFSFRYNLIRVFLQPFFCITIVIFVTLMMKTSLSYLRIGLFIEFSLKCWISYGYACTDSFCLLQLIYPVVGPRCLTVVGTSGIGKSRPFHPVSESSVWACTRQSGNWRRSSPSSDRWKKLQSFSMGR